ncbi:hypothetical protein GW17_00024983 [Ensete ventricosum]|nr:hypothetical protein GW17_00024983 [Ensete ventricosum]RZS29413.1 hypothetical protein BHM03_00063144 [Ensete ventricosum]
MRPRISIRTLTAAPLRAEPTRKVSPPPSMDHLRPKALVTDDAKKEAISAARYSDDVKLVSSWLSNLQYWLVLLSAFSLANTSGKNFFRNESIDVTPPILPPPPIRSEPRKKEDSNENRCHTRDSDIVAEDETAGGSDDAG